MSKNRFGEFFSSSALRAHLFSSSALRAHPFSSLALRAHFFFFSALRAHLFSSLALRAKGSPPARTPREPNITRPERGGCTARRAGRVSLYPARTAGHRLQGQNIMIKTFDNAWENQATWRPMAPRFSLTSSLLHCESLIRCFVGRASEMKCTHVMQCKFVSDILNAVQCSPPARIYTIDKA